MASVTFFSRRLFATSRSPLLSHARPIDTNFGIFQGTQFYVLGDVCLLYANCGLKEGDRVILNTTKGVTLTKPLKKDQKIDVRGGYIEHNHIIGKSARDVVRTHNGIDSSNCLSEECSLAWAANNCRFL